MLMQRALIANSLDPSPVEPGQSNVNGACAKPAVTHEVKADIKHYLPVLRYQPRRADACRCLSVVLRMLRLWQIAAPRTWRLLRFLFIRHHSLPSQTDGAQNKLLQRIDSE